MNPIDMKDHNYECSIYKGVAVCDCGFYKSSRSPGCYNAIPKDELGILLEGVRKLQWSLDHVGKGQDNDKGRLLARAENKIIKAL